MNISDIVVSNCASKQASLIVGIPGHSIEDVQISNMFVLHQGGGTKQDASIQPPELENGYPEPNRLGPMPAHAFYIRHAKGLAMRDVEIKYMQEDLRPPFVLNDVQSADFTHIKAMHAPGVPTFTLKSVEDFNLYQTKPLPDTQLDKVEEQTL